MIPNRKVYTGLDVWSNGTPQNRIFSVPFLGLKRFNYTGDVIMDQIPGNYPLFLLRKAGCFVDLELNLTIHYPNNVISPGLEGGFLEPFTIFRAKCDILVISKNDGCLCRFNNSSGVIEKMKVTKGKSKGQHIMIINPEKALTMQLSADEKEVFIVYGKKEVVDNTTIASSVCLIRGTQKHYEFNSVVTGLPFSSFSTGKVPNLFYTKKSRSGCKWRLAKSKLADSSSDIDKQTPITKIHLEETMIGRNWHQQGQSELALRFVHENHYHVVHHILSKRSSEQCDYFGWKKGGNITFFSLLSGDLFVSVDNCEKLLRIHTEENYRGAIKGLHFEEIDVKFKVRQLFILSERLVIITDHKENIHFLSVERGKIVRFGSDE